MKRFWDKVEKTDDCWLWVGNIGRGGYGYFKFAKKNILAHRFSYLMVNEIPASLQLDHLCRTRNCVNPNHLEPVTPRENTLRGVNVTKRKVNLPSGVNPNHNRFMANKRFNGINKYLGTFDTPEEAHKAYLEAA